MRWTLATSGRHARCQQRQEDEEKASGMSGSLQRQLLGCEYLISSRFQDIRVSEKGVDFGGDFKAVMSFDQSPVATSSGVGLSGWAMLQRRQDTISEGGCDDGCDNDGVHKGLVFTVFVTRSLSSFLLSTFYCFPYL